MQEHWGSDLFWFGDGRNYGVFPPLCILASGTDLPAFLLYLRVEKCFCGGASFACLETDLLKLIHAPVLRRAPQNYKSLLKKSPTKETYILRMDTTTRALVEFS